MTMRGTNISLARWKGPKTKKLPTMSDSDKKQQKM